MSLPGAISAVPGTPASVRIGVVVATSPLRVNVQGAEYTGLGVINYTPVVGHVVALLGQSSSVSADPTSWLVLGQVVPA